MEGELVWVEKQVLFESWWVEGMVKAVRHAGLELKAAEILI
jgi:hypothetical protein